MPSPGESGVMRKPLSGERGAWRRSWVSRGPVARPQAWGMFIAAARCKAAARPTPVSRRGSEHGSQATGLGVFDNRAGSGDTADSCELDDKDVYGTRLGEGCGGLRVLDGLVGGDGDGGVAVESGEGWDVGWGYGFFNELGGEFGQTAEGEGGLGLGPGLVGIQAEFMALPTALRVRARASSSMSEVSAADLEFEGAKAFLDCFCCQNFRLGGGCFADYGVDFNRSG